MDPLPPGTRDARTAASAAMLLLVLGVAAVLSLLTPWFAQYDERRGYASYDPDALEATWGLLGASAPLVRGRDADGPLPTPVVVLVAAACLALVALALLASVSEKVRWPALAAVVAAALTVALQVLVVRLGDSAVDDHHLEVLWGARVCQVAVLGYLVAALGCGVARERA